MSTGLPYLQTELNIFSRRIYSPYVDEHDRINATRYYSGNIQGLQGLSRDEQRAAVTQIGCDFYKFMDVALNPAESLPLRVLTMGMAMGDTLSNLALEARAQRKKRSALTTSREDFSSAATFLTQQAAEWLPFEDLLDCSVQLAREKDEHLYLRKGAIMLFNKLVRIGTASFHQTLDRTSYVARFHEIAAQTNDTGLRNCAIKVGAIGRETERSTLPGLAIG